MPSYERRYTAPILSLRSDHFYNIRNRNHTCMLKCTYSKVIKNLTLESVALFSELRYKIKNKSTVVLNQMLKYVFVKVVCVVITHQK